MTDAARQPSATWAARGANSATADLATLRAVPGLLVCADERQWWLSSGAELPSLGEDLRRTLLQIGGTELFQVQAGRTLVPWRGTVPVGSLPDGPWCALGEWLTVELPQPRWASAAVAPLELTLVPSPAMQAAEALLVKLAEWAAYVRPAPQVRLDRWEFAACGDGRVLVRGTPLPPLPGAQCCDRGGILTPAGWQWSPPIPAGMVRTLLGVKGRDVVLWLPETGWELIPEEAFVAARRANVRLTVGHFAADEDGAEP